MILYFDSYITDIPLYKNFVAPNDPLRSSCTNYAMPKKVDIAKYTLASYALYNWSHVLIRYELDNSGEYPSFDDYVLKLFPKAIIIHERSDSQADFRKSLEILDGFNDEWIFYSANNDHPIMANDISTLDKLVKKANSFRDRYKFISIVYSHFSEFANLPKKNTPFNSSYGKDSEIIEESNLATVIVRRNGDNSSVFIVNKNLFRHWFDSMDLGNDRIIRSEDIRKYFITHNQLMVIPKRELCAHFDGYAHTIGSRTEILPDQVPPLFIPPGFFENKVKIKYGYDDYREGWVNINPAAKEYSFQDNKHGSDLMWILDDIPLFWKDHIAEIDANPLRNDKHLKKMRDKKYQDVLNPWKQSQIKSIKYLLKDNLPILKRIIKMIRNK